MARSSSAATSRLHEPGPIPGAVQRRRHPGRRLQQQRGHHLDGRRESVAVTRTARSRRRQLPDPGPVPGAVQRRRHPGRTTSTTDVAPRSTRRRVGGGQRTARSRRRQLPGPRSIPGAVQRRRHPDGEFNTNVNVTNYDPQQDDNQYEVEFGGGGGPDGKIRRRRQLHRPQASSWLGSTPTATTDSDFNNRVGTPRTTPSVLHGGRAVGQPDRGRWSFATPGSQHLARFNADGTPDTRSTPKSASTLNDSVRSRGDSVGRSDRGRRHFRPPAAYLARFDADGTPDSAFNANVNGTISFFVHAVAVQSDGKILVGGPFGTPGVYLARYFSSIAPSAPVIDSATGGDAVSRDRLHPWE